MYCSRCGADNDDSAIFCSRCGTRLAEGAQPTAEGPPTPVSASGVGPVGVVFFCFPIAGAVMYFVWRESKPAKATRACTLALAGLATAVLLRILAELANA